MDEFVDEAATVRDVAHEETASAVIAARRAATCAEWPPDPAPPASVAPRRAAILRAITESKVG